ncbi:MAG: polyprenyl synthetase family protein [Lachnospiraceae bacterium]|nr:polyprenyl synthetase family protein [Lachnospiraceae bacterium]MDD3615157.1 polyprenyl synthetase family protein [Lachnospiraceae bacterium]
MNFKETLSEKITQAEAVIRQYLPKEEGFAKELAQAMNYSMLAGGKRLRPIFMQETYKLFGGEGRVIEPFMAAMEMIHTHSLIHDDLPALDNDEYRRGKKTTHVVYGEAMGILSGDALLNYAYETAFLAFDIEGANAARIGRALQIIGDKTGIYGMLGGQSVDVKNEGMPMDWDLLEYIYGNKTSALIECAMMTGAVLGGASEEEIFLIESVGYRVGLAFQIQDDILDITGDAKELGKPLHSDEKNHKTTYVSLFGLEAAKEKVEELTGEAVETLKDIEGNNEFLYELIESLTTRRK